MHHYPTAAPTRLVTPTIDSADLEMDVTSGSSDSYPDGSDGIGFLVVMDRGKANEEILEITSITDDTWTIGTRAYEGGGPFSHDAGAKIEPYADATTFASHDSVLHRQGQFVRTINTAGDLTINNTSWTDITNNDLIVPANVGDLIEVGMSAILESAAVNVYFDFSVRVDGAHDYYASGQAVAATTENGIPGLFALTGVRAAVHGSVTFVTTDVTDGDPFGSITLRPRFKSSAATDRTLNRNADTRFITWARNLGPNLAP